MATVPTYRKETFTNQLFGFCAIYLDRKVNVGDSFLTLVMMMLVKQEHFFLRAMKYEVKVNMMVMIFTKNPSIVCKKYSTDRNFSWCFLGKSLLDSFQLLDNMTL